MQRLKGDDGAVAVIVAVLAVVLFGFGAMVIDVGALYHEKRELQNGADAGSLAIAQTCSAGACTDPVQQARLYANSNAEDDAAHVQQVCGRGAPELDALAACDPAIDVPGAGFVAVRTATGSSAAAGLVPPVLARVLDPDYDGTTVRALGVANWGAPTGMRSVLPFAFGNCEWEYYTSSGSTYPGVIEPPKWPKRADGTSLEAKVSMAGGGIPCPGTVPGGDSSGGFGWLGGDADKCTEVTVVDSFVGNKTGVGTAGCDYTNLVGTTVHIPVFDCQTDLSIPDADYDADGKCYGQGTESGTSVRYHIVGYATFYVTGMFLGGAQHKSLVTGKLPCSGSEKCISGFFNTGLSTNAGPVGDGQNFGSSVVGLTYVAN